MSLSLKIEEQKDKSRSVPLPLPECEQLTPIHSENNPQLRPLNSLSSIGYEETGKKSRYIPSAREISHKFMYKELTRSIGTGG